MDFGHFIALDNINYMFSSCPKNFEIARKILLFPAHMGGAAAVSASGLMRLKISTPLSSQSSRYENPGIIALDARRPGHRRTNDS